MNERMLKIGLFFMTVSVILEAGRSDVRNTATALSTMIHGGTMTPTEESTKVCTICKSAKPLSEFHIGGRKGLPRAACKACTRIGLKKHYALNREQRIRNAVQWAKANPEKRRAASRKWVKKNLIDHRENSRKWREANKEKMDAARVAWRVAHPEYYRQWASKNHDKVNSYGHNRRAKYVGRYTKADIFDLYNRQRGLCIGCRLSLRGGYQVDHVMPIHLGGSNWPDNLQLLCRKCNRKKDVKHPDIWARENGRLFA